MIPFLLLIASFSLISAILTVYDKYASKKKGMYRIPENMLLLSALLGGAAAEYTVMKLIRHKTRHKKFMICLPLMTLIHIIILFIAFHFNF